MFKSHRIPIIRGGKACFAVMEAGLLQPKLSMRSEISYKIKVSNLALEGT